jgi:hypothetical protein
VFWAFLISTAVSWLHSCLKCMLTSAPTLAQFVWLALPLEMPQRPQRPLVGRFGSL